MTAGSMDKATSWIVKLTSLVEVVESEVANVRPEGPLHDRKGCWACQMLWATGAEHHVQRDGRSRKKVRFNDQLQK